jgi:O-antigen/teichoic acid export membrane protein
LTPAAEQEGARAALLMAAGRLLLQLLSLAAVVLLPWAMTTEDYGHFVAVMALLWLGMHLTDPGLGWLEMRLLAPAWRRGDRERARCLASTSLTARFALAVLVAALLAAWLLLPTRMALPPSLALLVALWLALRYVATAATAIQLSLGWRGRYTGLELLRMLLYVAGAVLGYRWQGLAGAFLLLLLAQLPVLLLAMVPLRRALRVSPAHANWSLLVRERHFLSWTALGALLSGVQFWVPLLLVGAFLDLREAAVLGVAVQALGVLHAVATGMRQGLMPLLSEQVSAGDTDVAIAWSDLLLRLIAMAAGAGLLLWLLCGDEVLAVLLPPDYAGLHLPVALVLLNFAILSAASAADVLLNLLGRARQAAVGLLGFAGVSVLGTAALLPLGAGASAVMGIYLLAALVFLLLSRGRLYATAQLRLPVARVAGLLLPGAAALFLQPLLASLPLLAAAPLLLAYLAFAHLAGLLSLGDVRRIMAALRRAPVLPSR